MAGLRNATVCCVCIYVASVNSGALGPFTPVDPEQERAIREFVSGRDIFVISPTGSGKVCASLRYLLCSTT